MSELGVFDHIADINPRSPSAAFGEQVSFVAMADVSEQGRLKSVEVRNAVSGYTPFAEGDVLVAKITPCLENGKGAHARNLPVPLGQGSTEFHVLRARLGTSSRYLYHLTRTDRFRLQAESLMTGSAGQRRVPTEFFRRYEIRVPPLEEQRRIAEILDTIDQTIHATERVIAKAELIEQGLKRALVGNKSAAADGWKQMTIGDLGTVVTGTTPSTADERYWHGPVPFITPGDINARGDVCNTDRRVTGLGADCGKRIPPGSVAVVCIGSTIGKVGRIYESSVTNQQINTIIPSPEYDSEFVACLLELARPTLEAEAGRQAVPIVNASVLRSLAVYVCPLGSQRDIVAPLHLLRDRINSERSLLTKLQQFRSGLAADLLSGCVRTVAA